MTSDSTTSPLAATASAQRPSTAPAPGEREKIAELAREFESFFILQMVRQMRQSMLDDEHGQGLGADTMTDTLDVELGRQLAASGGIGLTKVLQTAIERQVGLGSIPAEPGGAAGAGAGARVNVPAAAATPLAGVGQASARQALLNAAGRGPAADAWRPEAGAPGGAAALPLPVDARLSSPFGWRSDPFHGATRFHRGVDIAAAYGREVPAAGAGRVVFAGEQGGYGNTVVIEHAGGVRTRYAHLSSIDVEAGQTVPTGALIGRVGTSGRSTGPHLHFEVLQDGRPVDPELAATRYAGQLKFGGVVAD